MRSSLEEGLKHLCELWKEKGDMVLNRRLESVLNKEFLLKSEEESFAIEFGKGTFELKKGESSRFHAVIQMPRTDWEKVLKGEYSVQSVVIGGRCPYFKHQRQFIMQFSMVVQTLLLL